MNDSNDIVCDFLRNKHDPLQAKIPSELMWPTKLSIAMKPNSWHITLCVREVLTSIMCSWWK